MKTLNDITKIEYELSIFNVDRMEPEIIDKLIITKEHERFITIYNDDKFEISNNSIENLFNEILNLVNNQTYINEYIDDLSGTLDIYYSDNSKDELDRGQGFEDIEVQTLMSEFIKKNFK